jgi:TPR repeat protein
VEQDYGEAMACFEMVTDLEEPFCSPDMRDLKTRSDIAQIYYQIQAYNLVYPLAHHNLGVMYQQGLGGEEDEKEALHHFMLAAENNYAPSCLQAGTMLYSGEGLESSKETSEKAFEYLQTALEAGLPEAKLTLGVMYYSGEGTAQDKEKGIALLDELIAAGNVAAIKVKSGLLPHRR